MDVTKSLNLQEIYSARGLVIVVSGGGSGLGLAYTSAFVQTSAKRVYILGRRLEVLQEAAKSVDPSGGIVVPVQCDITDQASVAKVAKQVEDEHGYLDVLVNNSGSLGPRTPEIYKADTIEQVQSELLRDLEEWSPTFAVNVTAVAGMSAQFLPLLDAGNKRRGWHSGRLEPGAPRTRDLKAVAEGVSETDLRTSQIITTSSIASFNRHITAGLAYSSSKAAATMVGKTLATLLAPFGIRSNVIAPGIYPSAMTSRLPQVFPWDAIPAGRQGSYEDIAGTILHLVGISGAYLDGLVMITDGGRLSVTEATY